MPRNANSHHQGTEPRQHGGALKPTVRISSYYPLKRFLDRLAGCVLLLPGLPLIAVLVVLIRLTSRGPGIYSQKRVGRGGIVFTMYKLRSMRIDAETKTGPVWSVPGHDPRVTWLGYWLRKLHLDELPQIFNVVSGDMSLIGPRPERPEFVEVLGESIPDYRLRLLVEPGITGLAQINLPPDTDLNSVRRKIVLDLEYIAQAGLFLDCRMFLCTLLRLVGFKGEIAMRVMWLKRNVPDFSHEFDLPAPEVATPDSITANQGSESDKYSAASAFGSDRLQTAGDDDNERAMVFARQ